MMPKYKLFYYYYLCSPRFNDEATFSLWWALGKWYERDDKAKGSMIDYALDRLILQER
jgi:hypothetical protein